MCSFVGLILYTAILFAICVLKEYSDLVLESSRSVSMYDSLSAGHEECIILAQEVYKLLSLKRKLTLRIQIQVIFFMTNLLLIIRSNFI